jgi:hypothetical protein
MIARAKRPYARPRVTVYPGDAPIPDSLPEAARLRSAGVTHFHQLATLAAGQLASADRALAGEVVRQLRTLL